MPLFNQPLRLEKLSLHSFAKYLSDVCVCLVNSCRSSASSLQGALAACERLECFILDEIPHHMANSVTSEALECLNNCCDDISDCMNDSCSCKSIFRQFVSAILHPQVTELDIIDIRIIIVNYIFYDIGKLSQLNTFKVCVGVRNNNILLDLLVVWHSSYLKNLKCFALPLRSTNNLIRYLSKTAPGLTHLDVSGSLAITDKCINVMLRFRYLQSLDLSRTRITNRGYKRLLDKSRHSLRLQNFGLDIANSFLILSFPQCFQNLRRLNLDMNRLETRDLDDIAHLLQGLEELELGVFRLLYLPYFLTLKVLILNSRHLDVRDLPERCPRLETLMMRINKLKCRPFTKPFAHLLSLSVCVIDTDTDAIDALLSAAPNLVTFHFKTEESSDISIIDLFSKSSRLNMLQNLSVFSVNGFVDSKILLLIAHNSLGMTPCNVCDENCEVMKRWHSDSSKLKIKTTTWCGVHLHHP